MEKLLETGKAKGIGVCNYSKRYLEQLLPHCSVVPAINQIENHPNLPQQEIVDLCNEKGIHIVAYSPFGSTGGPVMKAEPVVKIAEKKGTSPSTVLLSYHSMFSPWLCFFSTPVLCVWAAHLSPQQTKGTELDD